MVQSEWNSIICCFTFASIQTKNFLFYLYSFFDTSHLENIGYSWTCNFCPIFPTLYFFCSANSLHFKAHHKVPYQHPGLSYLTVVLVYGI